MTGLIGGAIVVGAVLVWAYVELWGVTHAPLFGLSPVEEFFIFLLAAIGSISATAYSVDTYEL